jgi:hypothetical protein
MRPSADWKEHLKEDRAESWRSGRPRDGEYSRMRGQGTALGSGVMTGGWLL